MGNSHDPELGSTELGWEEGVGGCCLRVMVALPAPAPGVGGVAVSGDKCNLCRSHLYAGPRQGRNCLHPSWET